MISAGVIHLTSESGNALPITVVVRPSSSLGTYTLID
jgi:hypothetical protein